MATYPYPVEESDPILSEETPTRGNARGVAVDVDAACPRHGDEERDHLERMASARDQHMADRLAEHDAAIDALSAPMTLHPNGAVATWGALSQPDPERAPRPYQPVDTSARGIVERLQLQLEELVPAWMPRNRLRVTLIDSAGGDRLTTADGATWVRLPKCGHVDCLALGQGHGCEAERRAKG